MYNDLILSVSQCGLYSNRNEDGREFTVDNSLRKYIPNTLNQWETWIRLHMGVKLVSVPCYFILVWINGG